jgi:5'-3' exonuclease
MKVKELFEETIYENKYLDKFDLKDGYLIEDHSNDILLGNFSAISLSVFELKSLKGIYKEIRGTLDLEHSKGLSSLEFCPKKIDMDFDLSQCTITSLEHGPDKIGKVLTLRGCDNLTSLEGIGTKYIFEIGNYIHMSASIKSNILGVLKIKELEGLVPPSRDEYKNLKEACLIVNKHLRSSRRLNKCKEELIEAGLKEFANL